MRWCEEKRRWETRMHGYKSWGDKAGRRIASRKRRQERRGKGLSFVYNTLQRGFGGRFQLPRVWFSTHWWVGPLPEDMSELLFIWLQLKSGEDVHSARTLLENATFPLKAGFTPKPGAVASFPPFIFNKKKVTLISWPAEVDTSFRLFSDRTQWALCVSATRERACVVKCNKDDTKARYCIVQTHRINEKRARTWKQNPIMSECGISWRPKGRESVGSQQNGRERSLYCLSPIF